MPPHGVMADNQRHPIALQGVGSLPATQDLGVYGISRVLAYYLHFSRYFGICIPLSATIDLHMGMIAGFG